MDAKTVYYILGGILVASALGFSILGLSRPSFPSSSAVLAGVIAWFAVLVGGTTTFAVIEASQSGEREHNAEAAAKAHEAEAQYAQSLGTTTPAGTTTAPSGTTTAPAGGTTTTGASTAEGAQLFTSQGCSGCHTLKAANATGTTGPDLDKALAGKPASFIRTSIVDPNAFIAPGYQPNVMPQTFGNTLTPAQIDALVKYLQQSVGSG